MFAESPHGAPASHDAAGPETFDILSELPPALAITVVKRLSLAQRSVASCVASSWRRLLTSPGAWEDTEFTSEDIRTCREFAANSAAAPSDGRGILGNARDAELPLFVQLRLACRGHIRRLSVVNVPVEGRERAFLEFVHCNAFLRELVVHGCGLRVGEARRALRRRRGNSARRLAFAASGRQPCLCLCLAAASSSGAARGWPDSPRTSSSSATSSCRGKRARRARRELCLGPLSPASLRCSLTPPASRAAAALLQARRRLPPRAHGDPHRRQRHGAGRARRRCSHALPRPAAAPSAQPASAPAVPPRRRPSGTSACS